MKYSELKKIMDTIPHDAEGARAAGEVVELMGRHADDDDISKDVHKEIVALLYKWAMAGCVPSDDYKTLLTTRIDFTMLPTFFGKRDSLQFLVTLDDNSVPEDLINKIWNAVKQSPTFYDDMVRVTSHQEEELSPEKSYDVLEYCAEHYDEIANPKDDDNTVDSIKRVIEGGGLTKRAM